MHLFYVDRDLLHSCKREHRVFLSPAFKFSQPRIWQPFAGTFRLFSFFHSADCATANIPGVRFRARIRPSAD